MNPTELNSCAEALKNSYFECHKATPKTVYVPKKAF
jgi:hypothetical protein